jgi:hypothetical protein
VRPATASSWARPTKRASAFQRCSDDFAAQSVRLRAGNLQHRKNRSTPRDVTNVHEDQKDPATDI